MASDMKSKDQVPVTDRDAEPASLRRCVSFVGWYFYRPLHMAVACSTLFVLEEYSFVVFLGDVFRICRIQRFLVRQWIHGTASLRVFVETVFPYTAQCLVLSGTCYASVTELVNFHVFTWKSTSVS